MNDSVCQLKAEVPLQLKRQLFAALALRGERFNGWIIEKMQEFVNQNTLVFHMQGDEPDNR